MQSTGRLTLTQHIMRNQSIHDGARGQYSQLLTQIGVAGKVIAAQVRRAGLIEVWGATGETNVQGETVQKLDRIANDTLVDVLRRSGCVALMASEEDDDVIDVPEAMRGDYVVTFDPLDGSSNIDANVTIGTIFSIYRRIGEGVPGKEQFHRPGRDLVGAGYIIYGSSTALVLCDGERVDGFTLDPSCGEFFLVRDHLHMPETMRMLSINEGNHAQWCPGVLTYMDEVRARNTADKTAVKGRHIGSLVADFHRNLIKGGLFMYPAHKDTGRGKLRLLYECLPLAFIAETAGGAATDGEHAILDRTVKDLHERTGLFIGPKREVERVTHLIQS